MKRRRSTKAKFITGQPTPKSLSVRYTEVLKLRQAILRTQSAVKIQSEFDRQELQAKPSLPVSLEARLIIRHRWCDDELAWALGPLMW